LQRGGGQTRSWGDSEEKLFVIVVSVVSVISRTSSHVCLLVFPTVVEGDVALNSEGFLLDLGLLFDLGRTLPLALDPL
jgi:hypothetical protein